MSTQPEYLHVQQFLCNQGSLEDLTNQLAIKIVRSQIHPNLVLLKYDQIHSPFSNPLVRECRGLILDEANDWSVVSRSFDKFFNYGESYAASIDWSTAKVQEKLDGTLCTLYFYKNEWHVQTLGNPDALGSINENEDMNFQKLFWDTFKEENYPLPPYLWQHYCFIFELMTKHNRVVVQHLKPQLILIGIRCLLTQKEVPVTPSTFLLTDYKIASDFLLSSFQEIQNTFRTMNPLEQEGYVIVDKNFNRIKVKHPGYVAIHHLKEGMNLRRIVELVLRNEIDEVIAVFPEWKTEAEHIKNSIFQLCSTLENEYEKIKHISNQKEFAIKAVKTIYSPPLFSIRKGQYRNVLEFLQQLPSNNVLELIQTHAKIN